MNKQDISLSVQHVGKIYYLYQSSYDRLREILSITGKSYHQDYHALKDVNFEVEKGETFGIIGANGAGKSTLLKLITGVASATEGSIQVNGRISALLELGAGFNSNYTGIENIYLSGTMMGYTRLQMEKRMQAIVDFADIGEFMKQPVKTYSSGMFARLAFAVAINIEPEILIVDEALSVGDVFFQNKCYKKFEQLRKQGITVIFVSHDIGTVKQLCSRALWLDHGKQKMIGDSRQVCNAYSNSILDKRKQQYEKEHEFVPLKKQAIRRLEDMETYPEISFTEESILCDGIEIISSFLMDKNGDRISACMAGETYTLSIVFRSDREIQHCIAGFVMETVKGIWVINCNSAQEGTEGIFQVKKDTYNRVDFTFALPMLVNGDYVIGVAVSEGTNTEFKVLTWLYNVLYLQITNVSQNGGMIVLHPEINIYSRGMKQDE